MYQVSPGSIEIPIWYRNPTRLDFAQYGALVKVVHDDGSMELFVQTSSDIENCNWITLGELLAQTDCVDIEAIGDALGHYSDVISTQKKKKARETLLLH